MSDADGLCSGAGLSLTTSVTFHKDILPVQGFTIRATSCGPHAFSGDGSFILKANVPYVLRRSGQLDAAVSTILPTLVE